MMNSVLLDATYQNQESYDAWNQLSVKFHLLKLKIIIKNKKDEVRLKHKFIF